MFLQYVSLEVFLFPAQLCAAGPLPLRKWITGKRMIKDERSRSRDNAGARSCGPGALSGSTQNTNNNKRTKQKIRFLTIAWTFSTLRSNPSAPSSWPLGPGSGFGALLTYWNGMEMTTVRHVRKSVLDFKQKACAQGRRNESSENLGELIFRWVE